ncbi:MAG: fumarylacetoacetate hydrolase family protein, partial [Actinomycetota bacterium]|nr:fumarylacetoacetate hydrolase family protein [Actinomycetota bacterium]
MTTQSDRPPAWQLVSVRQSDGSLAAAVEVGCEYAVPEVLQGHLSLIDVMSAWPAVANALRSVDLHGARRIDVAEVLAPLTYPSKVLCSGPNFRDHLAEMGESGLGESWVPYFFFKPPTTTVVAAGAAVLVSGDPAERPDYEAELAVVIGVGGRDIGVSAAMDHVAGYLVANDISMRGPFKRETPAAPFVWDWAAQK